MTSEDNRQKEKSETQKSKKKKHIDLFFFLARRWGIYSILFDIFILITLWAKSMSTGSFDFIRLSGGRIIHTRALYCWCLSILFERLVWSCVCHGNYFLTFSCQTFFFFGGGMSLPSCLAFWNLHLDILGVVGFLFLFGTYGGSNSCDVFFFFSLSYPTTVIVPM